MMDPSKPSGTLATPDVPQAPHDDVQVEIEAVEDYEGDMECVCGDTEANDGTCIQCEHCNQGQHTAFLGFATTTGRTPDASSQSPTPTPTPTLSPTANASLSVEGPRQIPETYYCPTCLAKEPQLLVGHEATLGFLLQLHRSVTRGGNTASLSTTTTSRSRGRPPLSKKPSPVSLDIDKDKDHDVPVHVDVDVETEEERQLEDPMPRPSSGSGLDGLLVQLDPSWRHRESDLLDIAPRTRATLEHEYGRLLARHRALQRRSSQHAAVASLPRLVDGRAKTLVGHQDFLLLLDKPQLAELLESGPPASVYAKHVTRIKVASEVIVHCLLARQAEADVVAPSALLHSLEAVSNKRFEYLKRAVVVSLRAIPPNKILGFAAGRLDIDGHAAAEAPLLRRLNGNYRFRFPSVPALTLDGQRQANALRFLRRSCRPNASLKGVFVIMKDDVRMDGARSPRLDDDFVFHVAIMASHPIAAGEEITLPLDTLDGCAQLCGCHNDVNVVSWVGHGCLMPLSPDAAALLPQSNVARDLDWTLVDEQQQQHIEADGLATVAAPRPVSLKDKLSAASSSMRPMRYLPMSYKSSLARGAFHEGGAPRSRGRPSLKTHKAAASASASPSSSSSVPLRKEEFDENVKSGSSLSNGRFLSHRTAAANVVVSPSSVRRPGLAAQSPPKKKAVVVHQDGHGGSHKRPFHAASLLSPSSDAAARKPSLSREERKLQMYIETIERLEARDNKKRKIVD